MIKEVNKDYIKNYKIFPKLEFKTEIGDEFTTKEMLLRTNVFIDNYLVLIERRYTYNINIGLDYTQLMVFVDSIMHEVTNLKIHFKPELFQDSEVNGIYKIIE